MQATKIIIVLSLFFFLCHSSIKAQNDNRKKPWKAKIISNGVKMKGKLYAVSDSSLILLVNAGFRDEVLFQDIQVIKLIPGGEKEVEKVMGAITGAALGAWGTSSALTKGKEGEPRAMSGVVGGIGGGIAGGITGFFLGPAIGNLFSSKKFVVRHDSVSYQLLKVKLQRYSLTR